MCTVRECRVCESQKIVCVYIYIIKTVLESISTDFIWKKIYRIYSIWLSFPIWKGCNGQIEVQFVRLKGKLSTWSIDVDTGGGRTGRKEWEVSRVCCLPRNRGKCLETPLCHVRCQSSFASIISAGSPVGIASEMTDSVVIPNPNLLSPSLSLLLLLLLSVDNRQYVLAHKAY